MVRPHCIQSAAISQAPTQKPNFSIPPTDAATPPRTHRRRATRALRSALLRPDPAQARDRRVRGVRSPGRRTAAAVQHMAGLARRAGGHARVQRPLRAAGRANGAGAGRDSAGRGAATTTGRRGGGGGGG